MGLLEISLLRAEELRSVELRRLGDDEVRSAAEIWRAYVAPSPDAFASLATAPSCVPLADRLRHLLPRFPDLRDGLTAWERRLLSRIRECPGEPTARTVGSVLSSRADATPDMIGDMVLFGDLVELASAGLLAMDDGGRDMRSTRFDLTALGRRVLDGAANRVAEAGFDRWIGGTHLDATTGALWWFADPGLAWAKVPSRA